MNEFAIHAVPIASYSSAKPKPFEPIAADDDVRTVAEMLVPLGGSLHEWTPQTERDAAWVQEQLGSWANRAGPKSSVLLWVSHGESDGNDAWLADFGTTRYKKGTGHNATELADHLDDEWSSRRQDPDAWALVLIEACGAEQFVNRLAAAVFSSPNAPERFALLGGGGKGSSFLTAVPKALRAVLDSYEDNDEVIRIADLVGRLENRLAIGRVVQSGLGLARPLTRPRVFQQGVTAPHDVYAELKEYIAGLPADQRSFFVPKAQGTELGELTWYFEGRGRERRAITDWLNTTTSGLLAVTGPAGSGKSAVLGNLVVHTNPDLRELLVASGQVERLAAAEQPADNVFDASVLLTGLSTADVLDRLATDLGVEALGPDPTAKLEGLRKALAGRALTVMVDALDEAQDPLAVADVLRKLAELPGFRIVVGTRRSTTEGPDLAEPIDTNLLDALQPSSTVTVDLDSEAVTNYVRRRLAASLQLAPELEGRTSLVAWAIGSRNRQFLYARLAVHEILARPDLLTAAGEPELDALLAQDHRGLFAAAVGRLSVADSNFGPLLEALAHARGRGLPRADGIWAVAASSLADGRRPAEVDIDHLLDAAAPYVMLDGEHGQSTYRLAHQTFVEHFHAQESYAVGHRRIAAALIGAAEERWADANFYVVRYTPEHLVADADRTPPDAYRLADLVTDAGWLPRVIELLGVDQTVAVISAARAVSQQDTPHDDAQSTLQWISTVQRIEVVERGLRRSRIALTRDPAQLPAQLHARLRQHSGWDLDSLGDEIGRTAMTPWLRMSEGSLDWRADLESTYGTAGKVRGLAFGYVDGQPVVAIGVDERVELWDPRTGVPDVAATIQVGHRPTAVAMSAIDGRPVVVTVATYDGLLEIWDARTGERLNGTEIGLGHTLGLGEVNGRSVIAGVSSTEGLTLLDATTLEPVDVVPGFADRQIRGFGVDDGHLLVLAVENETVVLEGQMNRAHRVLLLDPDDGREIWRTEPVTAGDSLLDVMAGARTGAPFVVAAGIEDRMFWFTEDDAHVEPSPFGPRTRAIAVGEVDGRGIVVSSPDYDDTALVQLQQIEYDADSGGVRLVRQRETPQTPATGERFESVPVPAGLGQTPKRNASGERPLPLDRPEQWPQSVAATGLWDGYPVVATGSVDGAVWIWDAHALEVMLPGERARAVAGPFVELPAYVLERGWDLLYVKPSLEVATSIALGNLPERGAIVAVACGGQARLYTIADGQPITNPADEAAAVECVALGTVNGRTVLVTGSTGGNLTVWDPTAGTRVAGLALDDPIKDLRIEATADGRGQIAVRTGASDYTVQLIETIQR